MLTENFSAYYDLLLELRARSVPFVSLSNWEDVPPEVGVVITTEAEAHRVEHANVVVFTGPTEAVNAAVRILRGGGVYRRVIVGIDPGDRPGVAVIADGALTHAFAASSPEDVPEGVRRSLAGLVAERVTIRVGHGDPTKRDRILHGLLDLGLPIEIVDESRSTPVASRASGYRDIAAAKAIALGAGTPLAAAPIRPRPSEGELRDIQRKSRILSGGDFTIGRSQARRVALGKVTLEEAVESTRENEA